MKSSLAVVSMMMVAAPAAHALINFTSSELDLTNTAAITYDSNLTGSAGLPGTAGSKSDTYFTYSPRLDFTRKAGLIHLESNAGINFLRYFDQTNLNTEDVVAGLQLSLAEAIRGAYNGTFEVGYTEGATVEGDVNTRIQTNTLNLIATGEARLSYRMSLTAGANYTNSQRSEGSDTETTGGNVKWTLREFLRGTGLRLSYTYLHTQSDAGLFSPIAIDQTSHEITAGLVRRLFENSETTVFAAVGYRFLDRSEAEKKLGFTGDGGVVFNAGIEGPFLSRERFPKLTSSFALSYSQSTSPGLNDDNDRSLQGKLALDWQARERTKLGFGLERSRSLTVSNLTSTASSANFHVNQTVGDHLTGIATVAYTWSTYDAPLVTAPAGSTAAAFYGSFLGQSRKDETLSFTGDLNYSFARVWMSGARYEYRQVSSSLNFGNYDHHLVSLRVSCRY